MSYKIKTIPKFDKELKRLVKKYPSLKTEFIELVAELKLNPVMGSPLGNHCYKIRLSIASKGAGKSGVHGLLPMYRYLRHPSIF